MNSTLSAEQEAERLRRRERPTAHWRGAQRETFAAIWRRWDGRRLTESAPLRALEIYGDRGRTASHYVHVEEPAAVAT